MRKKAWLFFLASIVASGTALFWLWAGNKSAVNFTGKVLGAESKVAINKKENLVKELPNAHNINVPFLVQAPAANWDLPYQEACEEAAALMLHLFYQGKGNPSVAEAEAGLKEIIAYENKIYGDYKHTTVEQTANFMREIWGLDVKVVYDISIEDIKRENAAGRPVIVPAAGKLIGNPNYKNGGPLYHNLVIKGYTASQLITNDAGTRLGADWAYDQDKLYRAIGDWNSGHPESGRKAMILVAKD